MNYLQISEEITIIDKSQMEEYAKENAPFGDYFVELSPRHLLALLAGKVLATNDGEYCYYIRFDTPLSIDKIEGSTIPAARE